MEICDFLDKSGSKHLLLCLRNVIPANRFPLIKVSACILKDSYMSHVHVCLHVHVTCTGVHVTCTCVHVHEAVYYKKGAKMDMMNNPSYSSFRYCKSGNFQC